MKIEIPEIFPVTCHTRHVGPGSTFIAIKGTKYDGHDYIDEAIKLGATRIVMEPSFLLCHPELVSGSSPCITYVLDPRRALAELSAQALGYPAKKLKFIGITGTKGKSTTVYLVEHILRNAGYKTALLSTIKNKILDTWLPTELTTQQPDYLHVFFDQCVKAGVEWVVMEVAAQAATCHRVVGIEFDVMLFTNFSQEHGEFYATQDAYFADKQQLFTQLKHTGVAILNADDTRVAACSIPHGHKQLYSLSDTTIISNSLAGLTLTIPRSFDTPLRGTQDERDQDVVVENKIEQKSVDFNVPLILSASEGSVSKEKGQKAVLNAPALVGEFNAYNMLAAYTIARACDVPVHRIKEGMQTFTGVPGRLAKYELPNGAIAFIDYAHNPSSFEALFSTLRQYTDQLIVVFGCGGERDKTKRPVMGAIAAQFADIVILTSDNPRSEDPAAIVHDICVGIKQHQTHTPFVPSALRSVSEVGCIEGSEQSMEGSKSDQILIQLDREQAIRAAYKLSHAGSIMVLLGKGPDEYQLIKGVKYPFSEASILKSL